MFHNTSTLAIINLCSLTNKQTELEAFLSTHEIDILIGTESHLDNSIVDAKVFPKFYNVYKKDINKYEGGIFILIQNAISSSQLSINSPLEIIWTRLHLKNHEDFIVGSFNYPPNSSLFVIKISP